MSNLTPIGATCPNCEEHFLIHIINTDAERANALDVQLAARDKRIAELEAALREARSFINSVSTNKDALEVLFCVDKALAGGAS